MHSFLGGLLDVNENSHVHWTKVCRNGWKGVHIGKCHKHLHNFWVDKYDASELVHCFSKAVSALNSTKQNYPQDLKHLQCTNHIKVAAPTKTLAHSHVDERTFYSGETSFYLRNIFVHFFSLLVPIMYHSYPWLEIAYTKMQCAYVCTAIKASSLPHFIMFCSHLFFLLSIKLLSSFICSVNINTFRLLCRLFFGCMSTAIHLFFGVRFVSQYLHLHMNILFSMAFLFILVNFIFSLLRFVLSFFFPTYFVFSCECFYSLCDILFPNNIIYWDRSFSTGTECHMKSNSSQESNTNIDRKLLSIFLLSVLNK